MSSTSTWWLLGAAAAVAVVAACTLSTEGTMPPPFTSTTSAGGNGGDDGIGGFGGFAPPTTTGPGGGGTGGGSACADPVWGQRLSFSPELQPTGVAADSDGNVVTVTGFSASTDLMGTLTSAGGTDVLVAKQNSDGGILWAKGFGASGGANDAAEAVDVDDAGNVYVTGVAGGAIDFGGGPLPDAGAFVVALNAADGGHRWSNHLPSTRGHAIAVDTTGAAIVAGHFTAEFDVNGSPTNFGGMDDAIVVKFSPTGARQWVNPWGDGDHQRALGVATNAANSIYVTGEFEGTLDIVPGDSTSYLVNPGSSYDAFLVALNASGGLLSKKRFGGTGDQSGRAVAVDSTGAVIVAGGFYDTIDIDGDVHAATGSGEDIFVARFDGGGNLVWAKHFGDASDQIVRAVAVGPGNQIYVAGSFVGTLDFGAGSMTAGSATKPDMFVAVLRPDGSAVWSAAFGAAGKNEHASGVAARGCSVLLGGTFDNVFSVGPVNFPDGGGGYESLVVKINATLN